MSFEPQIMIMIMDQIIATSREWVTHHESKKARRNETQTTDNGHDDFHPVTSDQCTVTGQTETI